MEPYESERSLRVSPENGAVNHAVAVDGLRTGSDPMLAAARRAEGWLGHKFGPRANARTAQRRDPFAMLRSSTSPRLMLVADRRQSSTDLAQVAIRRFRLARLPLQARAAGVAAGRPGKRA